MKKNLKYYLSLVYPIELVQIPDDEGGGFSVSIPQLGRHAFIADGSTVEEALANLQSLKTDSFKRMLAEGIDIPEPIAEEEPEEFSGKFLVRLPKDLHKELVYKARRNGSSLNQYLQYVITLGCASSTIRESLESYGINPKD